jgi:hypothetical protein
MEQRPGLGCARGAVSRRAVPQRLPRVASLAAGPRCKQTAPCKQTVHTNMCSARLLPFALRLHSRPAAASSERAGASRSWCQQGGGGRGRGMGVRLLCRCCPPLRVAAAGCRTMAWHGMHNWKTPSHPLSSAAVAAATRWKGRWLLGHAGTAMAQETGRRCRRAGVQARRPRSPPPPRWAAQACNTGMPRVAAPHFALRDAEPGVWRRRCARKARPETPALPHRFEAADYPLFITRAAAAGRDISR